MNEWEIEREGVRNKETIYHYYYADKYIKVDITGFFSVYVLMHAFSPVYLNILQIHNMHACMHASWC